MAAQAIPRAENQTMEVTYMEFKTYEGIPVVWVMDDGFSPGVFQNQERAREQFISSMKQFEKEGCKVDDWENSCDGGMSCMVRPRRGKPFMAYVQCTHVGY